MVDFIRKNFIPVASDLRINERTRHFVTFDVPGELRLQRAWSIERYRPIGIHVVSPDGKLIASAACPKDSNGVLQFLKAALQGTGELPPRHAAPTVLTPDRGVGVRPDGTARLAVTIRAINHGRTANNRPVLDSILLTPEQLRFLTPPQPHPGARYRIPEAASREFVRALTDTGDNSYALRAQDATLAQLDAEVVAVSGQNLQVQVHGPLAGTRLYPGAPRNISSQGTADGLLTYSLDGKLQKLQIVCNGEYQFPWDKAAHTIGGLVEWSAAPR